MELPKFDISKAPHPQIIELLVPFIPGLFFEISVFAVDHGLLVATLWFGLGPYSRAALFLFGAYFCGIAAMVINNMILSWVLQIYRFFSRRLNDRLRRFETLTMHKRPSDVTRINKIKLWLATTLQKRRLTMENNFKTVGRVWGAAATQLLARRYGIESIDEQFTSDEWSAWRAILGVPTNEENRGSCLIRALGAAGLAGLLARYIAWPLHLFHYRTLCFSLITCELIYSLRLARFWMNPVSSSIELTKNVLRDLSESDPNKLKQKERE